MRFGRLSSGRKGVEPTNDVGDLRHAQVAPWRSGTLPARPPVSWGPRFVDGPVGSVGGGAFTSVSLIVGVLYPCVCGGKTWNFGSREIFSQAIYFDDAISGMSVATD